MRIGPLFVATYGQTWPFKFFWTCNPAAKPCAIRNARAHACQKLTRARDQTVTQSRTGIGVFAQRKPFFLYFVSVEKGPIKSEDQFYERQSISETLQSLCFVQKFSHELRKNLSFFCKTIEVKSLANANQIEFI